MKAFSRTKMIGSKQVGVINLEDRMPPRAVPQMEDGKVGGCNSPRKSSMGHVRINSVKVSNYSTW